MLLEGVAGLGQGSAGAQSVPVAALSFSRQELRGARLVLERGLSLSVQGLERNVPAQRSPFSVPPQERRCVETPPVSTSQPQTKPLLTFYIEPSDLLDIIPIYFCL